MSLAIITKCRALPFVASAAVRQLSGAAATSTSSTSPVDQMLEYAMGQRKSNLDMAVDVLMSGLSYTSPEADPLGSARLHLAIAQLEADRNRWSQAQAQAGSSLRLAAGSAAASAAAAEVALTAGGLATRALILLGHDREAVSVAAQCETALRTAAASQTCAAATSASSSSPAAAAPANAVHIRSLGLLALASRTAARMEGDGGGGGISAVSELEAALGPDLASATRLDPKLADAVQSLGLLRALQGRTAEAEAALAAAAEGAAAAEPAVQAALGADWAWQQHNSEVAADALTGRAQLLMRAREWGAAEEAMGEALKSAEAAHGDRSPSLAPILTLLGYAYSRSARVTFAEGLFREAAKLLRLDPVRVQQQAEQAQQAQQQQQPSQGEQPEPVVARTQAPSPLQRVAADMGVHASAVAVLAWRYAQLLWVLPNRGSEASRWEGCARSFWAASGGGLAKRGIEAVLGGQGHLRGEGAEGEGLLISTRFRRAWPCDAAP